MVEFIPISTTGRASAMNSISILTALHMISMMLGSGSLLISVEYKRHAKSQCIPLSQLISSLLKHNPGTRPGFFNQKMAQKEPKKNTPSTAANTIMCSEKLATVGSHHPSTHRAFRWTQGTVLITCRRCIFFAGSLTYVSMRSEYVSLLIFSTTI